MLGRGLDEQGLLLQSQLGWQLGKLTLFEGVTALGPGESLVLSADGIRLETIPGPDHAPASIALAEGVAVAAHALREMVAIYLDDTDDPTLQLTGGQDSRIVLSCIPRSRRRGLRVMTLDVPGTHDARIAGELAARYGMRHASHSPRGMLELSPLDWFQRVVATARANEAMADPIARAVTGYAEDIFFEQGERLSGLGGEVARGFYYFGRVSPQPITRRRTERLAKWRMLANEAVEPRALAPHYRHRALETSIDLIHSCLLETGREWFSATDALYLHRMRRWAGLGESAVSFQRSITNPMLDHRFIEVAGRLSPRSKQDSVFLAQLQVTLDEELSSLPLDDRPPPRAYAAPAALNLVRIRAARLEKLARKARQRLLRAHRPPAGGAIVAAKLAAHLRADPHTLDPVRETGVFDERWLDDVVRGEVQPTPGSLALLMNVLVATVARTE
nr:asparagine synthase-related protein [Tessaracoccus sp. OS52]